MRNEIFEDWRNSPAPMRTSERSRTIASTLLRLRASRAVRRTEPAYSSASVTKAMSPSFHSNPDPTGAAISITWSRAPKKAPKSSATGGVNAYSAKYCCIVSRRPALSAMIATRNGVDDR